ncbi:MAG: polyphosphate polymerase domain-containing protein [Bacillota bacterium]
MSKAVKSTFKRYELKYLLTRQQKEKLLVRFKEYMVPDAYGENVLFNLYYDTPDFLLIRRSIEKPVYKEKLRVRSYGKAEKDTKVFLELKKKYKSVVYKRRITLTQVESEQYFKDEFELKSSQIANEINYFKKMYQGISPRVFISYHREAFFGKEDKEFRVTFDDQILWRDTDLSLCSEEGGTAILDSDNVVMEIKVANGIPLWLVEFLTENEIYKTSFSKYGNAYKAIVKRDSETEAVENNRGGKDYVA